MDIDGADGHLNSNVYTQNCINNFSVLTMDGSAMSIFLLWTYTSFIGTVIAEFSPASYWEHKEPTVLADAFSLGF